MFGLAQIVCADRGRREREALPLHFVMTVRGETAWFACGPFPTPAAAEAVVPAVERAVAAKCPFRAFYYRVVTHSAGAHVRPSEVEFPHLNPAPKRAPKRSKRKTGKGRKR